MTITDQCIHGLDVGTCSLCADHPDKKSGGETLRALVREAFDSYPDRDEELVLRLVLSDVLHRDNAVEMLLPLLRGLRVGIDGERRRKAFDQALRPHVPSSLPGARPVSAPSFGTLSVAPLTRSRPETRNSSQPIPPASPAAPFGESETISLSQPIADSSPALYLPAPPPGQTLSEYARTRRTELEVGNEAWRENFARRVASTPMRIAGWRGRLGNATLSQIDEKMTRLRRQATGIADGIQDLATTREVLVATGKPTLDAYLESLKAS